MAKTEKEYAKLISERIEQATNHDELMQIQRQTHYYLGNQWIMWEPSTKQIKPLPQQDGEERITHNVIRPRVLSRLSKMTKNAMKYECVPSDNDQKSQDVAKIATKFLKYWWNANKLNEVTRDIALNVDVKNWCAVKVYFDKDKGESIGTEEDPLNMGEVVCRVVDSLSLFVDPSATTIDEIRWVVERRPRDVDYIKAKYKKEVSEDNNVDYYKYDITSIQQQQKKASKLAMVDEMWVAPCPEHPKGLKVTVCHNTLLDVSENAGEIPYFFFTGTPIPGTWKGEGVTKDMLPIQRGINITKSMFATEMKRMQNSKWFVPYGSNVDEDDINNDIGGVIYFNGADGGKPFREAPPNIPNAYDRLLEWYQRDIDDMSGAREISQGSIPAGLDTASGLNLMIEQENEKMAVWSEMYESSMKCVLERVLKLVKMYYTEERLIAIVGEGNEVDTNTFLGADLSGSERVEVVKGSSLPEMKSAQQQSLKELYQLGVFVDESGRPDNQKFLRALGIGSEEKLFEEKLLDENKAKSENIKFIQMNEDQQVIAGLQQYQQAQQQYDMQMQQLDGMMQQAQVEGIDTSQVQPPQAPQPLQTGITTRDFYDHATHIYVHNLFRKSQEYDELHPILQQYVDAHVEEHIQMMNAPMMQQQAQQEQMMMMQQQEAQAKEDEQKAVEQKQRDDEQALRQRELDIREAEVITKAQKGGK